MRVYRRAEFLKLPAGTMYAKGEPWALGSLNIKGDTVWNNQDWATMDPCWVSGQDTGECRSRLEAMLEDGASFPMETEYTRDGCFDESEVFLVFEADDLLKLRKFVDEAISVCEPRMVSA